jgi:filamentous hemagglutinin
MLASRGLVSTALAEFEYQVEVAYLGHTESMFGTGQLEGMFTPDYSAYFEYPAWAASNCGGLAASACMAGFQQDLQRGLVAQGLVNGAHAFVISAGAGLAVGVTPSAALALRQCAANAACWGDLAAGLGEAGLGLSGATAGQTFFTVSATGALAGKLILSHGDQILGVVDDLGRILRPVSQTPDDLGRFLVTTTDGVTGYLDDGRFVAEAIIGGKTCVYSCVINGTTRYVGITDDVARRGAEHLAQKGIEIEAISGLKNLSRVDARAVEQTLINYYGLGGNGGTLLNKINSISATKNPTAYEQALIRGKEILDSVEYPW